MGVILMFALAAVFGWAFTETANRKAELLQSQLDEKQKQLEQLVKQHEIEKQVWKNTVKELLSEA